MKLIKILPALVIGCTQFVAAHDRLFISATSVIPLVVVSAGVLTTAEVKNWGGLVDIRSPISAINIQLVDRLSWMKCTITLQVFQDGESKYYGAESPAILSCAGTDGARTVDELRGVITDAHGRPRAGSNKVGDKKYYFISRSVYIEPPCMWRKCAEP